MLTSAAAITSTNLWRTLAGRSLPREHGFEPLRVEGAIPTDLRGTLYRTGPGAFDVFGRRVAHMFEADGAVSAIRFGDGAARGGVRMVDSAGRAEERAAGRMLYGFSAPWPRRFARVARVKNTGNTNVVPWQGRLLALMEAAGPTEIDPDTLHTVGETDLGGALAGPLSAHPHGVAARAATYGFGLRYGRQSQLDLYELPGAGAARRLGSLPVPATMLHDFVATERHLVFFLSPVRVSIPRALLAVGPFEKLFEWRPELGTEVIVVPIDDVAGAVRFRTDAFYQWHFANAFERDGAIVVDFVRYDDLGSLTALAGAADGSVDRMVSGYLHRATIDPRRGALSCERMSDTPCEFPRVHPRVEGSRHRFAWLQTEGAAPGISRLDLDTVALDTYALPAHQRASEPVFAPRPGATGEADGYVLSLVYDGAADASFVAVLDAAHLADGPIARAWFDHHIPITFHGNWMATAPT